MSVKNAFGSERAWHMAIANLQSEIGRMQATADAIPTGSNLDLTGVAVIGLVDLVERHARCLRDYEVALNCVLALLHSCIAATDESSRHAS